MKEQGARIGACRKLLLLLVLMLGAGGMPHTVVAATGVADGPCAAGSHPTNNGCVPDGDTTTTTTVTAVGSCFGIKVNGFCLDSTFFGFLTGGSGSGDGARGSNGSYEGNEGQGGPQGSKDSATDCNHVGDPIMLATGDEIWSETEFKTSGEMPLSLTRSYNRFWTERGIFGYYWISNFDLQIRKSADGQTITAYRSDGRKIDYRYTTSPSAGWYEVKASSISYINASGSNYVLHNDANGVETYNAGGQLISIKNQRGIGITLSYSGGNLYRATHTSGRYVQFNWTNGYVTSVRDPAGNIHTYTQVASSLNASYKYLASATYPGAPTTTMNYLYELTWHPGVLTGISINGSRYSTITYDNAGDKALGSELAGGVEKTTLNFTDSNGVRTVLHTNALGKQTAYEFKGGKLQGVTGYPSANCPNSVYKAITYDSNGYRDLVTDFADGITDYDYNAKGQLIVKTEGKGTSAERATHYLWDASNRMVQEKMDGQYQLDRVYRSDGLLGSFTIKNLSANGVLSQTHTTTYGYTFYTNGMIKAMTENGPLPGSSDAVVVTSDALGNTTSVKNGLGFGHDFSNFTGLGQAGRDTNSNGGTIDYTHDPRGRVTATKIYVGGTPYTTTTTYDGQGRIAKITDADGITTDYYHDGAGRLLRQSRPNAHSAYASLGSDIHDYIQYTYNANSDVIRIETGVNYLPPSGTTSGLVASDTTLPAQAGQDHASGNEGQGGGRTPDPQLCAGYPDCYEPPNPTPTPTPTDYLVTSTFIDYDELGRVIARRGNHGQNVRYTYDDNGNVQTLTDSLGKVTTIAYDALGRVISVKDALNGATKFDYDDGDHLVKVTDPRNRATSYAYDGFGQLWSQSSPDTGVTSFVYDAYGRRTSMTRADNAVTSYGYDGLGRLLSQTTASGTHTYTYDNCTGGTGALCALTYPNGSLSYTYTPQGWLSLQREMIGSYTYDQAFSYDGLGRVTDVGYTGGVTVHYGYDAGAMTTMTATVAGATQNIATNATYQPFGGLAGWTYGNGLVRRYDYDSDGRVIGISAASGATVRQSLTYAFNANDVITKITNGVSSNQTQTYTYDALNRLTSMTGTGINQQLTHDANGNIATYYHHGAWNYFDVATTSNRLLATTGGNNTTYQYDANGNVVSGDGANYTYDGFNRLTRAVKGGVTTTYWVNGLGLRSFKYQSSAKATQFVYGPDRQLAIETNHAGWVRTHYLRFGGELVALVRGGQVDYIHPDQLGRPEVVTNSAKSIVWQARNYAFDRTVVSDSIGGLNLGFPGQYYDAETGNWNNGFRDYVPELGRYLESDPIGLGAGTNTYAYALGNPIGWVDPSGLCVDLVKMAFGAIDVVGGTTETLGGTFTALLGVITGEDFVAAGGGFVSAMGMATARDGLSNIMTSVDGKERQGTLAEVGENLFGPPGRDAGQLLSDYGTASGLLKGGRRFLQNSATAQDILDVIVGMHGVAGEQDPCNCNN